MLHDTDPLLINDGKPVQAVQTSLWTHLPAEGAGILVLDPQKDAKDYESSGAAAIVEYPNAFGYRPFDLHAFENNLKHPEVTTLAYVNDAGAVLGAVNIFRPSGSDEANLVMLFRLRVVAGGGMGRKLLIGALEYAHTHGDQRVTLDVMPDNPAARSIYEEAGFKVYARSRDEHDAIWMELRGEKAIKEAINRLTADLS